MVESTLNYLARMGERPFYWLVPPPEGRPWRNTKGDRRTVKIHDARGVSPEPSLDAEGFTVVTHETAAADLFDAKLRHDVYFPEVEELVRRATGADRVVAFDHNLRSARRLEQGEQGIQNPVRLVHNDYTEASGPQRVRDLMSPEEVPALLQGRFAVINVWKPIGAPVLESPLAVCDARSIRLEDMVLTDLEYADRRGEIYSFTFSPEHRWYYYPEMQPSEALLLKCFDTDPERARFTAHTAFDDPGSPAGAPDRESIEVRTLAFFS